MSRSFTKLFSSITESTVWSESLATRVVWITMLAMADRKGRVWASVPGLAHRARVTTKEAEAALDRFLAPDRYSRTTDYEGRRIEAIDGGWRLLNHAKYRDIHDEEERREYQAKWIAEKRNSGNVDKSRQSRPSSTQAEAEAETETETSRSTPSCPAQPDDELDAKSKEPKTAEDVIAYLNAKTGRRYQPVKANLRLIRARLREGSTVEQLCQVVDFKAAQWLNDADRAQYLRPATLFNAEKYASYVGQLGAPLPWQKPWHESASGIEMRGRELGIARGPGEPFPDFKERVKAADRERST